MVPWSKPLCVVYFEMVALSCRPVKCLVFRHKQPSQVTLGETNIYPT